jgi:hypothetical protein
VSYRWSPADGLSCTDCASPLAAPSATTRYVVAGRNGGGCETYDTITVTVRPNDPFRARIGEYHGYPGRGIILDISGDGVVAGGDTLELSMGYDPGTMLIDGIVSVQSGWSAAEILHDIGKGIYVVRMVPARDMVASGALVRLHVTAFLGPTDSIALPLTVTGSGAGHCLDLTAEAGFIRLDSVCGIRQRLIERINGSYSLDGNHPNPFNPSTDIDFSLGLDGPTSLVVYDGAGRAVARLVDEHLGSGSYRVNWDASGFPSGTYRYRLVSGTWSAEGTMVLRK